MMLILSYPMVIESKFEMDGYFSAGKPDIGNNTTYMMNDDLLTLGKSIKDIQI